MIPRASLRLPEVLAPAGDEAAMRAAVLAGADAVYFGLSGFNARARATNFDVRNLTETLKYLHENGVRGYVTLNTLVFDEEFAAAESAVRACALAGVDAVIVQDLGVLQLVRNIAPDMPIHASTQMTCTDAASIELARSLGVHRVIVARELSVAEIAKIRAATDVEVEVFVHGALCIAYSGQCLTSEAIGGRSANRGACAQACRLPYEVLVDGELKDLGDKAYLLSPEDLEASALVPKLIELGVTSLKIEGRLKGPEYVAATTRLYKAAVLEAGGDLAPLRRAALQMFTRGSGPGFLEGVNHQRLVEGRGCDHRGLEVGSFLGVIREQGKSFLRVKLTAELARGDGLLVEGGFAGEGEKGGRVWSIASGGVDVEKAERGREVSLWFGPDVRVGAELSDSKMVGRRVFRTNDPAAERAVLAEVNERPHRVRMNVEVTAEMGAPARFVASTDAGGRAEVVCDVPTARATSETDVRVVLRDKLGRLGDSPFVLGDLSVDVPKGAMIAPSAINRARRALVSALVAACHSKHKTTNVRASDLVLGALPPDIAPPKAGLFVLCRTLEQALAACDAGADGVTLDFLELTGTGEAVRTLRARGGVHITLAAPRIRKPGEEKIDKFLLDLQPDALLVRSLGALRDGAGSGVVRIGDFSLNVTNKLTAALVLANDLAAFTPSFDLDAAQLSKLLASPFGPFAEVVIHHPMPLFYMEHCVIAALLSDGKDHKDCGRPCDRHLVSLRDRAGMVHPVEADVGCRNTVFHAAAQSGAGVFASAKEAGVRRFRVELVREKPAEVKRIVETYRSLFAGGMGPAEVFRALGTEGGVGVVRGSLRVLHA